MPNSPRRQVDRDLLDWCRRERESALETLRLITKEGWTYQEVPGGGAPRDVTREHEARQKQIIRLMDRLIERYEKPAPGE